MRTLSRSLMALFAGLLAFPASAAPFAYVPNCSDNNVSIIDTATNAVVNTIALPGANCPVGVAADAAGSKVYFASSNGAFSALDIASGVASAAVAMPGVSCSQEVAVNPAGTRAFVSGQCSGNVAVLDLAPGGATFNTALPGFNSPFGVAVSPDGSRAYVADYSNERVVVIDTTTLAMTPIATPGSYPRRIAIASGGDDAWISDDYSHHVRRISNLSGAPAVGALIAIANCPEGIAINADADTVYVASRCGNTVTAIDAATGVPSANAATGAIPTGISISPAGDRVLVVNTVGNSVSTFNAALAPLATTGVGNSPLSFGIFIAQPYLLPYDARPEIIALRGLVTAANLSDTRLRNSLYAPLDAALNWLNGNHQNRVPYACSNLAKFIVTVRQNISAGKLPPATGNPWVTEANDILSQSGCATR